MNTIYIICFLFLIVAIVLAIWCIDTKEAKRDRVKRLEDDQRYINNKRNGWDW